MVRGDHRLVTLDIQKDIRDIAHRSFLVDLDESVCPGSVFSRGADDRNPLLDAAGQDRVGIGGDGKVVKQVTLACPS